MFANRRSFQSFETQNSQQQMLSINMLFLGVYLEITTIPRKTGWRSAKSNYNYVCTIHFLIYGRLSRVNVLRVSKFHKKYAGGWLQKMNYIHK